MHDALWATPGVAIDYHKLIRNHDVKAGPWRNNQRTISFWTPLKAPAFVCKMIGEVQRCAAASAGMNSYADKDVMLSILSVCMMRHSSSWLLQTHMRNGHCRQRTPSVCMHSCPSHAAGTDVLNILDKQERSFDATTGNIVIRSTPELQSASGSKFVTSVVFTMQNVTNGRKTCRVGIDSLGPQDGSAALGWPSS